MNKKQRTKMNKQKKANRPPIKREFAGEPISNNIDRNHKTLKKNKKKNKFANKMKNEIYNRIKSSGGLYKQKMKHAREVFDSESFDSLVLLANQVDKNYKKHKHTGRDL